MGNSLNTLFVLQNNQCKPNTMNQALAHYSELVPAFMSVIALAIVIIEWLVLAIMAKLDRHKEGWVNILSAALTYLPIFILNIVVTIAVMFWLYQYRIFDLGLDWYVWILAYIAYDFMSYAIHWLSHKVRFFWCIHSVHHSPKEMKASVAFRGSWAEFLLAPHLILWLPLLGFHPMLVIIVEGVGQLYGVPLHFSEHVFPKSKLHWVKNIFITPSLHRLHHAKNDLYIDTNYGLTFSLWDRLFNTFQHESPRHQPAYGLQKELDSENLLVSQTDEFVALWRDVKAAPTLLIKLKYLVMPPGWNHENGGATARQIRQRALQQPIA